MDVWCAQRWAWRIEVGLYRPNKVLLLPLLQRLSQSTSCSVMDREYEDMTEDKYWSWWDDCGAPAWRAWGVSTSSPITTPSNLHLYGSWLVFPMMPGRYGVMERLTTPCWASPHFQISPANRSLLQFIGGKSIRTMVPTWTEVWWMIRWQARWIEVMGLPP